MYLAEKHISPAELNVISEALLAADEAAATRFAEIGREVAALVGSVEWVSEEAKSAAEVNLLSAMTDDIRTRRATLRKLLPKINDLLVD